MDVDVRRAVLLPTGRVDDATCGLSDLGTGTHGVPRDELALARRLRRTCGHFGLAADRGGAKRSCAGAAGDERGSRPCLWDSPVASGIGGVVCRAQWIAVLGVDGGSVV